HTRSWAANSTNERVRQRAEIDRLRSEVFMLREEIRIKDARLERLDAKHRPRFSPTERMAILELRAARGWSQQRTADVFHVSAATIASWCKRLDEEGPNALVRPREPVNRFPDFVRYIVRSLEMVCPFLGKRKIAQMLARAGLHLGATTVGRILREPHRPAEAARSPVADHRHTAKRPNHVWHVDLTVVPTGSGFWIPWLPNALLQRHPFAWWLAVVVDGYSRCIVGFAVFDQQPDSDAIRGLLGRAIRAAGAAPKYLICDRGVQFDCRGFRDWAKRRGVRLRYGAIGRHGSLAVIERLIGTLKREGLRRILVPFRRDAFRREVDCLVYWYNEHRPHAALDGATPHEFYHGLNLASRLPRIEPRPDWPRPSPCAAPQTLVAGRPGERCELEIEFVAGRRHLPVVTLKRAA
ncbi:MAG: DDE-type integrase/transposase/recombinase, partial [Planctomycetaceae bacterium]